MTYIYIYILFCFCLRFLFLVYCILYCLYFVYIVTLFFLYILDAIEAYTFLNRMCVTMINLEKLFGIAANRLQIGCKQAANRRRCPTPAQSRTQGLRNVVPGNPSGNRVSTGLIRQQGEEGRACGALHCPTPRAGVVDTLLIFLGVGLSCETQVHCDLASWI